MANPTPDAIAAAVARTRERREHRRPHADEDIVLLCDIAEQCVNLEKYVRQLERQAASYGEQIHTLNRMAGAAERERDEARAECAELREELKQRNKSGAKCCAEERRALQVRITALTEALRVIRDDPSRDDYVYEVARAALAGEVGK